MTNTKLTAAIRAAFADVPYPGDDNIGDSAGRDDAENVTEVLRGRDWCSVNNYWNLALCYMTPEACHYYLPAFLLGSLNEDGEAVQAVRFRLTLDMGKSKHSPHMVRLDCLLSETQKQAVRDYLAYELQRAVNDQQAREDLGDKLWDQEIQERRELLEYWNRI